MGALRPQMMRAASWLAGTRIAVNAIGALSSIILARLLLPEDFGLVAIALATQAVVSAMLAMSPGSALIREARVGKSHVNTSWTLTILRALLVALVLGGCSWPLALIYDDPRLIPILWVIGLTIFVGGFRNPALILYQRRLVFWQDFFIQVPAKLASIAVAVAVAAYTGSYWALVVGTLVTECTSVAASYAVMPYRPRFTLRRFSTIWAFTQWLSLTDIVQTLNWRSDDFLIGGILGQTKLGAYSIGNQFAAMPVQELATPLTQTLYPAFSTFRADLGHLRRTFIDVQRLLVAVALPVGFGLALVADPLVRVVLGPEWTDVIIVIQLLSPLFAMQVFGHPCRPVALSLGATRPLFHNALLGITVRLPLLIGGLLLFGLPGVVAARVLSGLFGLFLLMLLARRLLGLGFRDQITPAVRSFASLAVMVMGVGGWTMLHGWAGPETQTVYFQLAGTVTAGAVLYIGTHALLWSAAGRPPGAESDILALAIPRLRSLKRRLAS